MSGGWQGGCKREAVKKKKVRKLQNKIRGKRQEHLTYIRFA